jgi:hypothetical protein
MKIVHILLMLIIAASALGCVGKKPSEVTTTGIPAETSASPTETSVSGVANPTPSGNADIGTQSDINTIDSGVNDSSMDISLSDANI